MSPRIVAMGGATLRPEDYDPRLDAFVLSLARRARPRVCFVATASGDSPDYVASFYRAFSAHHDCVPSDLGLFDRTVADLRGFVLSQDVVWVGGGNTASLLAVWRMHGLDLVLREAWEAGVVLCGGSAGSLCWFAEGVTAFHGEPRRYEGLGLLPWSNCVHYDGEPERDGAYRRLLVGGMRGGFAAEDGSALHFVGTRLARVVASRARARAYRMRAVGGRVERRALMAEYLGAPAPVAAVA